MNFELWYDQEMSEPIKQKTVQHSLFMEDGLSNKIGVRVTKNGQPVELEGECYYLVLRADGYTVYDRGVVEGNTIYAVPAYSSYLIPGRTQIFLRLINGDTKTVLLALAFDNKRTTYGSYIDPSHIIPDIHDIIERFDEMGEAITVAGVATEAANNAAQNANTKANLADEKATLAQQKADLANEKATLADEKAGLANTKANLADEKATLAQQKANLADEKAGLANTAAQNANEKANLADEKATLANQKAALADEKAGIAQTAANNADEKASLANEKAKLANQKANLADEKAGLANTAAQNADDKASLAQQKANLADEKATLANEKAGLANNAAVRADAAALLIDALTMAAHTLQPGSPVTVDLSIVNGHYHIDLGITKGDTGDEARITDEVVTYTVTEFATSIPTTGWQSAIPVIPQGWYFWIRYHRTWNNGQETDEYSVSRNGLDGEGSVKMVDGISPDGSGNVHLDLQQTYYTKDETYSKEDVYSKQEAYAKSETYSKQEVEQKISDMNFFTVNNAGELCQRYEEEEEEEE